MNIEIDGNIYAVKLVKTGHDRVLLKLDGWNVLAIDPHGLYLHGGLQPSGLPVNERDQLALKYR